MFAQIEIKSKKENYQCMLGKCVIEKIKLQKNKNALILYSIKKTCLCYLVEIQ